MKNMIFVKGLGDKMVNTQDFLLEFKQTFEQIMLDYQYRYINASAAGAHIEGTIVKSLKDVIENDLVQEISVKNLIASALDKRPSISLSKGVMGAKLS